MGLKFGLLILSCGILSTALAGAGSVGSETNLEPIGKHFPIFIVEKSENPQNALTVYTRLELDCRIVTTAGDATKPVVDFYWLMDRERYKPVHPLIKRGIRDRLEVVKTPTRDPNSFAIQIVDLSPLNTDLGQANVEVKASQQKTGCHVDAFVKLGPSDKSKTLRLISIYTESKTTFLPPFRKPVAVTLKGFDAQTGLTMSRTYSAK